MTMTRYNKGQFVYQLLYDRRSGRWGGRGVWL